MILKEQELKELPIGKVIMIKYKTIPPTVYLKIGKNLFIEAGEMYTRMSVFRGTCKANLLEDCTLAYKWMQTLIDKGE